jgi:hypothetical protein
VGHKKPWVRPAAPGEPLADWTTAGVHASERGLRLHPLRRPLVGVGRPQQDVLFEHPADQLQAEREAVAREAARHRDGRQPGQRRADGEVMASRMR